MDRSKQATTHYVTSAHAGQRISPCDSSSLFGSADVQTATVRQGYLRLYSLLRTTIQMFSVLGVIGDACWLVG